MERNTTNQTEESKMKWTYKVNTTKFGWNVTRTHVWEDGTISEVLWGEYGSYEKAKNVADKENKENAERLGA
jgi:hypothetical protein